MKIAGRGLFIASIGCVGLIGISAAALAESIGSIVTASVTRVQESFLVEWSVAGAVDQVTITEGTSPDEISSAVAVTGGTSVSVSGLDPTQRHYFRIKGGSGQPVIAAERGVPQMNVLNFRDVGGYATAPNGGGHSNHVRWGVFYRAGAPSPASNQAFLDTLGVKTILDVRALNEVTATQLAWSRPGVTVVSSPISDFISGTIPDPVTPRLCLPSNTALHDPTHHYFAFDPVCFADQEEFFGPNGEFFTAFKTETFRSFVTGVGRPGANFGPTVATAMRAMLLRLADASNLPFVLADSGGAARTGWGVAVALMAAGVSEDLVVADYLITNSFRAAANNAQLNALIASGRLGKRIYLEPQLFEAEVYMRAALDELHLRHGTFESYARDALGITAEELALVRENLTRG